MIWSFQFPRGYLCISVIDGREGLMLEMNIAGMEKLLSEKIDWNKYKISDNKVLIKYGNPLNVPYFAEKVVMSNSHQMPIYGDIKELLNIISRADNDVVFYTGAGISMKAGIWGAKELSKQLFLNDLPLLCETSVLRPEKIIVRFKMFIWRMKLAKPTPAHISLKNILNHYCKGILVTENLDTLHQETGVKVHLAHNNKKLYSLCPKHVITLGLSCPNETG